MSLPDTAPPDARDISLIRLFGRFLAFGGLAWGGPVAQISMMRDRLVDRDGWLDDQRFSRVLGVYQALPGPEATQMAMHFGMMARGRIGGIIAALGFILPGLVLMLAAAAAYVALGPEAVVLGAVLYGLGPVVCALVVNAAVKIARRVLTNHRWLWIIAITCGACQVSAIPFLIPLAAGGLAALLASRHRPWAAGGVLVAVVAVSVWSGPGPALDPPPVDGPEVREDASLMDVVVSGTRAGALTFGGAYTVIPFLQNDAVVEGEWLSGKEFVDGLAIATALPAPLVIIATFVGYLGAGLAGGILMSVAVFAPALLITLLGYRRIERLLAHERLHSTLDGVTAAVIGFIVLACVELIRVGIVDIATAVVGVVALGILLRLHGAPGIITVISLGAVFGVVASLT